MRRGNVIAEKVTPEVSSWGELGRGQQALNLTVAGHTSHHWPLALAFYTQSLKPWLLFAEPYGTACIKVTKHTVCVHVCQSLSCCMVYVCMSWHLSRMLNQYQILGICIIIKMICAAAFSIWAVYIVFLAYERVYCNLWSLEIQLPMTKALASIQNTFQLVCLHGNQPFSVSRLN